MELNRALCLSMMVLHDAGAGALLIVKMMALLAVMVINFFATLDSPTRGDGRFHRLTT